MKLSKLDIDFYALLKSQAYTKSDINEVKTIKLDTENQPPIAEYVDINYLNVNINKILHTQFIKSELDFLWATQRFTKDFVQSLGNVNLPDVNIEKDEDDVISIELTGRPSELALTEAVVQSAISSAFHIGYLDTVSYDKDQIALTGANSLDSVIGLLRSSNIGLVESGTLNRYDFEWQAFATTVLLGALHGRVLGTTNSLLAFTFGLTPVGWLKPEDLALEGWWDRKDVLPAKLRNDEWKGLRISETEMPKFLSTGVDPKFDGYESVVVETNNILDVIHFGQHSSLDTICMYNSSDSLGSLTFDLPFIDS